MDGECKKHHIAELIIKEEDNKGHMVTEYVLGNISNKYWIINRRLIVKQVSRRCFHCKRENAIYFQQS